MPMTTRDTLTQALRDYYQDLMNRYPAQRANTPVYNRHCADAKLVRLKRNISVKGTPKKFVRGDWALMWRSGEAPGNAPDYALEPAYSLWKPGAGCPTSLIQSELSSYVDVAP